MSRYNIENFKLSFLKQKDKNIDKNTNEILINLAKKLNCFHEKKYKNTNEKYIESLKNFKVTQIKNNLDNESKYLQNIRKILNIITDSNYINYYDEIYKNLEYVKNNFAEKYKLICEDVYKLLSTNYLYSKPNCQIFKFLIKKDNIIKSILDYELENFIKIFDNLIYISPDINYDNFCKYNKYNEQRRAKINFYINLYLINVIDCEEINRISIILIDLIKNNLNNENYKNEIDELSEYNYLIITEIYEKLFKENENYANYLFSNVLIFSNYKLKDYKSITNKFIFKHMDIIDELS